MIEMPVNIEALMLKAETLLPDDFANRSEFAKYKAVRQLLISNEKLEHMFYRSSHNFQDSVLKTFCRSFVPLMLLAQTSTYLPGTDVCVLFSATDQDFGAVRCQDGQYPYFFQES